MSKWTYKHSIHHLKKSGIILNDPNSCNKWNSHKFKNEGWQDRVFRTSEVAQLCATLSDPMDCSLPGSSIHGIFRARVLEWGAIAFSHQNNYMIYKITLVSRNDRCVSWCFYFFIYLFFGGITYLIVGKWLKCLTLCLDYCFQPAWHLADS